ncbi:MAG: hypothetical protein Alis3KO_14890 [Aliiglaciecola sp.]
MKKHYLGWIVLTLTVLSGCSNNKVESTYISVKGQWLVETNGDVMLNPQTSGLKLWRNKLISVSDASADVSQQLQLHVISKDDARVASQSLPMQMSARVGQSCFGPYLNDSPDLEALAVDPRDDRVILVVTEDATRSVGMSQECQLRFNNSGSTDYPTVLIRLELQDDNTLLMTHARPLQFASEYSIGNFPNDGVEALAFSPDGTLYLGLEKDITNHARIFSLAINDQFWSTDDFAQVIDEKFDIPQFDSGTHPINGMDYLQVPNHKGFLVAAARNDNQLWIIDIEKQRPTKVVPLQFLAPTNSQDKTCPDYELMDNSSLEGVAINGDTIWMVNDPWKRHYLDNVVCETNRSRYEKFAPLLFSMPIQPNWLN